MLMACHSGGMQLAVDTTPDQVLHGLVADPTVARRKKERTYPELMGPHAGEVGGRLSMEAQIFL